MTHFASPSFWSAYEVLPPSVKQTVDQNYEILKTNPKYPSLHFKKINHYWAIRAGIHYRALAVEVKVLCFGFGSEAMQNMKSSSKHNE